MEHPPPFHQDTPNHFQGIVPVSLFPSVASKATLKIFSMALQRVPAQKGLLLKCAITHNKSLGIQDRTDIHSSMEDQKRSWQWRNQSIMQDQPHYPS
jgi:hypothetical protein